jgi:hypothetical protein
MKACDSIAPRCSRTVAKDKYASQARRARRPQPSRSWLVLAAQGKRAEALAIYQQATGIMRHLVEADPDNVELLIELVADWAKVATVSEPPAARPALNKALAILEKLEAEHRLPPDQQRWPEIVRAELAKLL